MPWIILNLQISRNLGRSFGQLIDIQMKGDATFQTEKTAVAVQLEDGFLHQVGRFTVEHKQVPVQKPGPTQEYSLILNKK